MFYSYNNLYIYIYNLLLLLYFISLFDIFFSSPSASWLLDHKEKPSAYSNKKKYISRVYVSPVYTPETIFYFSNKLWSSVWAKINATPSRAKRADRDLFTRNPKDSLCRP